MTRGHTEPSRVLAVLGPTNTGKTHFAVERMLAHGSGMIGCPLRLLAREIFDRIVVLRGPDQVSLVTGEEKIGPPGARYVVATTEAMPVERAFAFVAVDEIQLCADWERGHVFTDRLLRARGTDETMFMGSDTIRPLMRRLVPQAEIVSRPRFSVLAHSGHAKLTRLPRRSAVVAFTAADVYRLAEVVRRQRGGAAVVMGALSPRTRNAQVELYQSGEVDYMIATDAIGMGLNMDLGHVAFASLGKFDGRYMRRLRPPEIAQIAGRAGRHMADGTFGTTDDAGAIDDATVASVEGHEFRALQKIRWRNADLDFSEIRALQASLDARPPAEGLIKVRDALDDRSLALLAVRADVRARATGPARVRLLWRVCQIPDFRKTLTDAHLHLLETVFLHLSGPAGVLPTDWVGKMLARLDRADGDIDTLMSRLAHVRTWTYVAHQADWLADPAHWQGRAREVEDRLSDALHERLTQRFVDRRATALMRSLRESGDLQASVSEAGEMLVDGHRVGHLEGLRFVIEPTTEKSGRRTLSAAARRVLEPELLRRASQLMSATDDAFTLDDANRITWSGAAVGYLRAGSEPLAPQAVVEASDDLPVRAVEGVRLRLERWVRSFVGKAAAPLLQLETLLGSGSLAGPARGLAYQVVEGLGSIDADAARTLVRTMSDDDRKRLGRAGIRFGVHSVYIPAMLKPAAVKARALLQEVHRGRPCVTVPSPGRTCVKLTNGTSDGALLLVGYRAVAGWALRVDILERVSARIRALARAEARFALTPDLAALTGLSWEALATVVDALGYGRVEAAGPPPVFVRRQAAPRRKHKPDRRRRGSPDGPFAALEQIKGSA